ncbi:MAG: sensor histidine kinase [Betaproteobacteria bacterium]|jgi:two-component system sensor histidine kinase SenX3|nr:HAMP domain-containing histidine kinase [Rhodocyclaceae bacterium]MCA3134093.1 HAMP domain-containing histidine kinase [Rhodocyclaceae bacterium]MCA3142615.1 HAMP domain-containing histidine kinase [Rhodocyclaceae bacterium]MCA3144364.1 HAMP domain-containing histidine kinase [Rhodocyclaceae bacterium]MCE2897428.1 HAMP domain-containing histidine kinase [Betaproteobacteria bacterium]
MNAQESRLDLTTYLVSAIHDMKNSVGVMTAELERAMVHTPEGSGLVRAGLSSTLWQLQRLRNQLVQAMALYRIHQNFYPFDPSAHAMTDFGAEALAWVEGLALTRGMEVRAEVTPGLTGFFDRDLVSSAVVQALHNGMRFARRRVNLTIARPNDWLELRVEDDGEGFPEAILGQPSGPVGRLDHAAGSAGLGLYFSQVVAELHRHHERAGRIRLENGGKLGGACFVLQLP